MMHHGSIFIFSFRLLKTAPTEVAAWSASVWELWDHAPFLDLYQPRALQPIRFVSVLALCPLRLLGDEMLLVCALTCVWVSTSVFLLNASLLPTLVKFRVVSVLTSCLNLRVYFLLLIVNLCCTFHEQMVFLYNVLKYLVWIV